MCGLFEPYLQQLQGLNLESDKKLWPAVSLHSDPGQPLLLLSLFDLFEQGKVTRNFFSPADDLHQTFSRLSLLLLPTGPVPNLHSSFCQLASRPFWQLIAQTSSSEPPGHTVEDLPSFRARYLGGRFSADLYPLLVMATSRSKFKEAILQNYFSTKGQQLIAPSLQRCE